MKRMYDEKQVKALGAEGAVAEIAGGNVENAKPIYFHPLLLANTGGTETNILRVMCMILNNDPTPFTLTSFRAWLKNKEGVVRMLLTGAVKTSSDFIVLSDIRSEDTENLLYGVSTVTGTFVSISMTDDNFGQLELLDQTNKIN